MATKLASWTVVLLWGLAAVSVGADRESAGKSLRPQGQSPGKAVLIKKIEIKSLGFDRCSDMRLGDLDRDNQLDVLLVQNQGQSITSLTAVDITGRKLWQVGEPNSGECKSKSDMPIQIYDIDQDGVNEVLCVMGDKLVFLNG